MSGIPYESRSAMRTGRADEAPEADTVEQYWPAAGEDPGDEDEFDVPLEADPADAAEQRRVVGDADEEDYR